LIGVDRVALVVAQDLCVSKDCGVKDRRSLPAFSFTLSPRVVSEQPSGFKERFAADWAGEKFVSFQTHFSGHL
jgi:hypothetical protein